MQKAINMYLLHVAYLQLLITVCPYLDVFAFYTYQIEKFYIFQSFVQFCSPVASSHVSASYVRAILKYYRWWGDLFLLYIEIVAIYTTAAWWSAKGVISTYRGRLRRR